jgi:uncharacterized protein
MPVSLTYPGVYIEEMPSGVRTIVGVATSVTAFIGRTRRGPVNEPEIVNSFGDFERRFGGLWTDYPMSYAVKDFFLNGGSQALIVRLYKEDAPAAPDGPKLDGIAKKTVGGLKLMASSPGEWGNNLKATIDKEGISADVAKRYDLSGVQIFNLMVEELIGGSAVRREIFRNVATNDGAADSGSRRVDRVLANESSLMRVQPKADGQPDVPSTPVQSENALFSGSGGDEGQKLTNEGDFIGAADKKTGLYALDKADIFNILCIPPDAQGIDVPKKVFQDAEAYCKKRRAMLIVDPPVDWGKNKDTAAKEAKDHLSDLNLAGEAGRNAALYFPMVLEADPLREGQIDAFAPCGIIAGIMARIDAQRGVWKSPAGLDASINGIVGLQANLNDEENGMLNPLGINCLRDFKVNGRVVWGARTLRGADQLADEWKYIPVRRTALFIEESLYRGLQWVVFEPNDEPLWSQIRLNAGAFMHNLFRQGAFQGRTPREAYFVKCDKETTTQNDINLGIVNIVVGFAPLKPAEFVVIKIQQMAGQIQT